MTIQRAFCAGSTLADVKCAPSDARGDPVIVRCTARLLKLLAPVDIADAPSGPDDWYANLVWINRRKCVLLVHAETLFPVFVADVRKPQLSHFGHFVAGTVATALADEGLLPGCLGPLDPTHVQVARTASRSVLGFMNDMVFLSEHMAAQAGGVTRLDIEELNAFLRRTPYNRGGYIRPRDAVRQR
ncbi:hypothetical protein LRS13_24970 [Svornostia abyssi]|uniref:DUF6933 domain-containing protein n=1 Tax=Svornostia abyssi TaxID=2898438 RepID=A0ABY5PGU0_9ACTN|nr:hypothetical protein LRS13_24970 [Parviterribacteraceae bacterium J379]